MTEQQRGAAEVFCGELIPTYQGSAPHPYFLTKVDGKITYQELEGSRLGGRLKEMVNI